MPRKKIDEPDDESNASMDIDETQPAEDNEEENDSSDGGTKKCQKCNQERPLAYFATVSKQSKKLRSFQSVKSCIECRVMTLRQDRETPRSTLIWRNFDDHFSSLVGLPFAITIDGERKQSSFSEEELSSARQKLEKRVARILGNSTTKRKDDEGGESSTKERKSTISPQDTTARDDTPESEGTGDADETKALSPDLPDDRCSLNKGTVPTPSDPGRSSQEPVISKDEKSSTGKADSLVEPIASLINRKRKSTSLSKESSEPASRKAKKEDARINEPLSVLSTAADQFEGLKLALETMVESNTECLESLLSICHGFVGKLSQLREGASGLWAIRSGNLLHLEKASNFETIPPSCHLMIDELHGLQSLFRSIDDEVTANVIKQGYHLQTYIDQAAVLERSIRISNGLKPSSNSSSIKSPSCP